MASLQLRNVYKVYDGGVRAVSDFNLDIADKEFVVFVGPSGCGKSTTLRMIAGLEEITAGSLFVDGEKVNDVQPKDRNIAMVFQNYALYPHMTVFQNMAFGLKLRKLPMDEITRRVNRAAEILGIEDLLTRKPKALSGGQRQRVALGRAIVREPNVFLLDEPLSNLDAKLRVQMRTEITKLHKKLATTFIYVTHDQTEAMTMGDRIVVMKDGFIQQADTPATLYDEPANVFVATFLGSPQMNVFQATLQREDNLQVVFGNGHKACFSEVKAKQLCSEDYVGKQVLFGIRPENITLGADGIAATVDAVEHLGSETIVYADVDGLTNSVVVKISTDHSIEAGQNVSLVFNTDKAHLFDENTSLSVMGVPAVNSFSCVLDGDDIRLSNEVWQLPQYFKNKLFAHAFGKQIRMEITTDKVLQQPVENCMALQLTVDFVVTNSDSRAIFCTSTAQNGHFVFRTKKNDYNSGEKITVYVPFDAISFVQDGVRLNSRFDVPTNTALCKVQNDGGVTAIHIGGKTLRYPDLGFADGDYMFRLRADKLSFVYNKTYARKNKLHCDNAENTLAARSYDEDKLGGGKNAVFVQVGGFDSYVVAILDDEFSVYKMPDFPLVVPQEGFDLLPLAPMDCQTTAVKADDEQ